MPDCPFTISGPATLTQGQSGTFQVSPTPDGAVCSVQWTINGQPARPQNTYDDVFVVQVGFSEMIVRATSDEASAVVGARVTCTGAAACGPTDLTGILGTPAIAGGGIQGGAVVLIVLLPFVIIAGVALLPVIVVAWIIDKATSSDTTKQVKKVSTELRKLLPRWPAKRTMQSGE